MKKILATLAVLVALPASAALADTECNVPPEQRQSFVALAEMADDFGWSIHKVEIDDGCYELRVTDRGGNLLKVTLDPETLDVVEGKVKRFSTEAPRR